MLLITENILKSQHNKLGKQRVPHTWSGFSVMPGVPKFKAHAAEEFVTQVITWALYYHLCLYKTATHLLSLLK